MKPLPPRRFPAARNGNASIMRVLLNAPKQAFLKQKTKLKRRREERSGPRTKQLNRLTVTARACYATVSVAYAFEDRIPRI